MELCWLAGDDPNIMDGYEKMPIIDYLLILDKRIGENRKLAQAAKNNAKLNGRSI